MIEKARELGLALANSPEFLRMAEARHNVTKNSSLCELMDAFREKRDAVVELMGSDDVDKLEAIAMTTDLDRLQQQLFENPLFNELVASEQEFQTLLNSVNQEINACIGLDQGEVSCGGNCAHCRGCEH